MLIKAFRSDVLHHSIYTFSVQQETTIFFSASGVQKKWTKELVRTRKTTANKLKTARL
jgi:hypothetical protein